MKELTISKLRMGSLAGFYAIGFGVFGLLIGLFYVMADSFQFAAETQAVIQGLAFGVATGWINVFLVAVMYAVFGAIVGFIQAIIFNLIFMKSGGVTVETK